MNWTGLGLIWVDLQWPPMTPNDLQWTSMTSNDLQWLTDWPQMTDWRTSNDLQWLTDWFLLANRIQLCGRVPILMIYQGHQEFPPESVIKKTNQIAFSHCCMVVIRFHFLPQSSESYWPFGLVLWQQNLNSFLRELLVSDGCHLRGLSLNATMILRQRDKNRKTER